jgi:hypothetical protein
MEDSVTIAAVHWPKTAINNISTPTRSASRLPPAQRPMRLRMPIKAIHDTGGASCTPDEPAMLMTPVARKLEAIQ